MRILAIDLGRKRIGLALSDPSATLARPWKVLERGASDRKALNEIARVAGELAAEDDGLGQVVVGLPLRLDGSPTDQTPHVQEMAEGLRRRIAVPVVLQDERLSSHEADSRLAVNERDWRRRKAQLDAAAAAVILQDYLDARARHAPAGEEPPVR